MSDAQTPPIRLVGISKRYSGTKALDDVSLEIEAGKVHALYSVLNPDKLRGIPTIERSGQ